MQGHGPSQKGPHSPTPMRDALLWTWYPAEIMEHIHKVMLRFLVAMLCVSGCALKKGPDNSNPSREGTLAEKNIYTTTDLEAAVSLFPSLKGIETLEMEQIVYGDSSSRRTIPGPSDYLYRGYITVSDEAAAEYAHDYVFSDAAPDVSFETIRERKGPWKYSYDFQKNHIKNGYFGDMWINGNTILFSIGTM